jgi:hypothetical protein
MIDYSIFISPNMEADKLPCFVTSGKSTKDEFGIPTLNTKLEFIKVSDFDKYEPFSRGKALIPMIKKIK